MAQAQEALAKLRENADAVICFENDRMGDMVAPKREFIRRSPWLMPRSAKACARS
jgi:cell division GTPase FtsZ